MFCRLCRVAGATVGAAMLVLSTFAAPRAAAAATMSPNLLVNPGAEVGDPSLSGYSGVTIPGWTVTGTPTVIKYNTLVRLPSPLGSPGPTMPKFLAFLRPARPARRRRAVLRWRQCGDVHHHPGRRPQRRGGAIDGGAVPYTLSGWLGGNRLELSEASATVEFLAASQLPLGTGVIGPVSILQRGFQTELFPRETTGTIPAGTRSARVTVTFKDTHWAGGAYNHSYADNLSFTIGAPCPPRGRPRRPTRPSGPSTTCSWSTWRTTV